MADVQAALKDWSEVAANNGPLGTATVGAGLDDNLRQIQATIKTSLGHIVSVKDYGAVGDGTTDDTTAIENAITAVKTAGGGTVSFPVGSYKCNLSITGERVCLQSDAFGYDGGTTVSFVPATLTDPVISIGDGTTQTRDITLNGVSLYGNNSGDKGLRIYGANDVYLNRFTSRGFEEYQCQIDSSATRSTFFIFVNGFHIQTGTTAGSLGLDYNYGSSFATAIFFTNGAFNAAGGGSFCIDINGSGALLRVSNVWIDADDDQGINFATTGTKMECANVFIDSGSAADSLVTIPSNTSPTAFIYGTVWIDGVLSMPGGDTNALTTRYLIPNEALINNPHVTGGLSFQDSNASAWVQTQTGSLNQRITRSGTTLIVVSSDGDVRISSSTGLHINGGSLRLVDGIAAPGSTSGQAKIYVDTADGDLKVVFGDGTIKTIATDS